MLAETGCAAVKLEGGEEMAETVAFLARRGVPVMGHVGLTPQAVNALGGYRSRGHAEAERDKIMRDGLAVAEAGAFSLVIEGTAESVARELTAARSRSRRSASAARRPATGRSWSPTTCSACSPSSRPKFVKRYRRLGDEIRAAAREYAEEVRAGRLPGRGAHLPRTAPPNPRRE